MRIWIGLLVVAMVGACMPILQPPGTQVVAPSIELERDVFVASDGTELPLDRWGPEAPRAILIGVHGMNDYARTFELPGPWFSERGVAIYAYDQRGFGRAPHRGLWAGSDVMARDFKELVRALQVRHPDVPVYALGVSMGGAVVLTAMADADAPTLDGVILSAPAVWGWQAMNPFYKMTLWLGAHVMPGKTLSGGRLQIWPSDNIEMLREISKDPLMIRETRIDAVYGLVTLMDDGFDGAPQMPVRTLVVYGLKDEIIPRRPVLYAADKLPDGQLIEYDNGYHMLLRDLQREVVWQDIQNWIEESELD